MAELGRAVEEGSANLQRRTALAVHQTVVVGTPVDEGRARSNWNVANGGVDETVRDTAVPGSMGSTGDANTAAAIARGRNIIARHRRGQSIHITNNLPYIEALNNGSSAQAPAGFVEEAIAAGNAAARRGRVLDG